MNKSIKSLILAAGVAVATVSLTVPAHADPVPGPGVLQQGPIVDPQPDPEPQPPADDVNVIAIPPQCTHGCGDDQGPQGPKDIANPTPAPADEPTDEPTEVTNGGPLHAAEPDLDQGCFTGCDLPEEPVAQEAQEPTVVPVILDSAKPSAADQLDQTDVAAPQLAEDGGLNPLLWVLVGGAGLGALFLAAVARRRRQAAAA